MARKKPDGPVGVAIPPDPPPAKRAHNRKGVYTIQRQITAREVVATASGDAPPPVVGTWIDGAEYQVKAKADKALADLMSAGVFRVAQVYPAVELTVEDRPVVTSRKPV